MCAAWEALPEATREKLDGCLANQSYEAFNQAYSVPTNNKQKARSPDIHHPIVRTHPVTGKKALYLCPGMTTEIVGWDADESAEMLAFSLTGPPSRSLCTHTLGNRVMHSCGTTPARCIAEILLILRMRV